MSARTATMAGPTLAQVNLLPEEIREARSFGVVKRWMVAAVGVTAMAVGTVTAVAQLQNELADSQLAEADAETTALLAQQRPYAEVVRLRTELDTVRSARSSAFAHEILWADYLGALVAVTPDGVGITSIDYLGATPLAASPPSTDPLVSAGVGTLTFRAVARDVPDTAAWADALDAVAGFDDARMDTVALVEGTPVGGLPYEVTGSVQVDAAAYSHRFDTPSEERS